LDLFAEEFAARIYRLDVEGNAAEKQHRPGLFFWPAVMVELPGIEPALEIALKCGKLQTSRRGNTADDEETPEGTRGLLTLSTDMQDASPPNRR
jgi:hypothetical protein